jgi:hypothetical protein
MANNRDLAASVWARELGMGDTMFKHLEIGARFCFVRGGAICIKTKYGYRHETGNQHQFKTGARTATFRIDLSPSVE